MADFRLNVVADTDNAQRALRDVEDSAVKATQPRNIKIEIPNYSDISKNFKDLNKDVSSAANGIKQFYQVASKIPVGPLSEINQMGDQLKRVAVTATETSRNVGDAGDVIKSTFNATNKAAETLVSRLTRIAFSLYIIQEAASAVQTAFGGFFNETIGREIKLRETILKTQTTLASTNKVFKDGKEITDPYQKIVSLTGAVRKNIDSIRERSIALAGVTSGDVIEVFGIVASQVGQIGGGLKEAEDLAINFAAALGTFGIPLYQARQEIGSILRGDITTDSYLAKAIGITNEDIAKAKTQAGGVVKFLEERLAAAVAGQRIAAEGFSGVMSNIRDLGELISQNFGAGLLDPLLDSLTQVFNALFSIRNELFAISKLAGQGIGTVIDTAIKLVGGATGGSRQTRIEGGGGGGRSGGGAPLQSKVTNDFGADDALNAAKGTVKYIKIEVSRALSTVYLQISTLLERVTAAFIAVGGGLAGLAKGLFSLKLEQLKSLVGIVESLSPALLVAAKGVGAFLGAWGKFMELPLVQEISQIAIGMRALEMSGVMGLVRSGFLLQGVLANWGKVIGFVTTQFNMLRSMIGGVIAWMGQLVAQAGRTSVALLTAWAPAGKALQSLRAELLATVTQLEIVGNAAQQAGSKIGGFESNAKKAGGGVLGLIGNFIKFNLIMFAISAAVSILMERFSAYKESQDKIASDKRAQEAIRRLSTTYKDLGENATEAQKRAKAFEQSLVDQKYDEALANLEKLKKKVEELRDTFQKPTGFNSTLVGKELNNMLAALNPANFDISGWREGGIGAAVIDKQLAKQKAAETELAKYSNEVNKLAAEQNLKLEANNRKNLEKEIGELRKQQDDQIFQLRQQRAAKEVDIFRAAGELRIFQIEQANKKLIEGEEGASRAALEALNNYISVRERGELEIETAKKQLVIEVTNLERQISDYRLENEKKIAEIRKRAGENDKAIADYQRQVAGQTSTGSLRGGAVVTQRNDRDGEQTGSDIVVAGGRGGAVQNPFSSLKITAKGFQGQGSGPRGRGFGNYVTGTVVIGGKTYEVLLGHLDQVSVNVGDVLGPGGLIGTQGMTGRATGPHVTTHVNALNGGNPGAVLGAIENAWTKGTPIDAAAQAITPPKLQSFDDIGAPAVAKYTEAVRGLSSAMERLRVLTAALTNAKTKAAFDEIAKAAFQPVGLDSYQDKLYELGGVIKSLADGTYDAFNPERSQIAAEQAAKVLSSERELAQIKAGINKVAQDGLLSEKQRLAIIDSVTKQHKAFVDSLRIEEQIRQRISAITQITDFIKRIEDETARIERENEVIRERNRLLTQGADPAFIEQEVARLRRAQELSDAQKNLNTLTEQQTTLQKELNAARAAGDKTKVAELEKKIKEQEEEIKRLREELKKAQEKSSQTKSETPIDQSKNPRDIINNRIGNLKRELDDLTNWGNIAVKAADGIGAAFSDAFKSVVSGASTVQEALGTMFQRIGEMFLQMATEIIAKMLVMYLLKSLLGLFGKGAMIGGTDAAGNVGPNMQAAKGATFSGEVAAFAGGGLFTNKIVKTPTPFKFRDGGVNKLGIMGEAGPEAIMPLRRGSSGRLGVDAIGLREAMNSAPGAGGAPILNMSFETTSIGGTEYVSRDQLEAAMSETRRQASRDGAQRGMTMTLDRLQQSPRTRNRLGMR